MRAGSGAPPLFGLDAGCLTTGPDPRRRRAAPLTGLARSSALPTPCAGEALVAGDRDLDLDRGRERTRDRTTPRARASRAPPARARGASGSCPRFPGLDMLTALARSLVDQLSAFDYRHVAGATGQVQVADAGSVCHMYRCAASQEWRGSVRTQRRWRCVDQDDLRNAVDGSRSAAARVPCSL